MRVLVGVLVLVAVSGGSSVFAQSQPGDFFMEEFTFGLLGGLVGGPTLELLYVSTLCREAPNPALCQELGIAAMQLAVYLITLPAGVSAGVIIAGSWRGVENTLTGYLLTYTFATVGSLTGWLNAAGIIQVMDFLMLTLGWDLSDYISDIYTFTRVALPILYASFLGTVGFNTNARMRQASALMAAPSWKLPLFTVRF
uniref:Uncharacterized protein n=1 Tax=Acetithermum autotrophicum TaxID=1446466 RepID=H5SR88_ACEAU|nr:hypothetical protein HGMM_OP2C155 [Candidatus Acetothermum autotrophicum]